MGTIVSMSSFPNEEFAVESFKSAFAEYKRFSKEQHTYLWELLLPSEIKSIKREGFRLTNWTSGKLQWATLPISQDQLNEYAWRAFQAAGRIETHFEFASDNGYEFYLNLELYGKKYEGGHAYFNDGFVRVTCSYNNLFRPVLKVVESKQIPHESIQQYPEYRDAFMAYRETIRKMFISFSKANTNNKHCFGYLESGFPLPAFCFAIYHNEPNEYVLDFYRMYFGLKYDIHPTQLYNINKVEDFFQLVKTKELYTKHDLYYKTLKANFPDAFSFFEGLQLENLELLRNLPEKRIPELILLVEDKLKVNSLEKSITVELVESSYCIIGAPNSIIYLYYKLLYTFAVDG